MHNDMKEIHTSRRFFHTWSLKETQNHVSGNLFLCFLNPNPKDEGESSPSRLLCVSSAASTRVPSALVTLINT